MTPEQIESCARLTAKGYEIMQQRGRAMPIDISMRSPDGGRAIVKLDGTVAYGVKMQPRR